MASRAWDLESVGLQIKPSIFELYVKIEYSCAVTFISYGHYLNYSTSKPLPSASRNLSGIENGLVEIEPWSTFLGNPWHQGCSLTSSDFSLLSSCRDRSGDNLQSAEIQIDVYGS